jgi:hypothetical protein
MSRGKAIALAILTAWPFLYMILFMCIMFGTIISDCCGGGPPSTLPSIFLIIIPLHLLTMLEMVALLVIYIVHVFKTDRVPQDKKALWAVVLFLGNMLAMPVYWYFYIWPAQVPPASEPRQSDSPSA